MFYRCHHLRCTYSSTPKKPASSTERPSSTSVKVQIEWPSNRVNRKVPEQLESLAKMLIRGTYKQIASATWRSPIFKERTSASCSKRHRSRMHCNVFQKGRWLCQDNNKLLKFSFDKFNEELSSKAPFLHAILLVGCVNGRRKNCAWKQALGMAAAICLRNRSHYMNGAQLLLSIFGYHSNWMVRNFLLKMWCCFLFCFCQYKVILTFEVFLVIYSLRGLLV